MAVLIVFFEQELNYQFMLPSKIYKSVISSIRDALIFHLIKM
jgi:hypothetical protein